jgi:hypothetical protein
MQTCFVEVVMVLMKTFDCYDNPLCLGGLVIL